MVVERIAVGVSLRRRWRQREDVAESARPGCRRRNRLQVHQQQKRPRSHAHVEWRIDAVGRERVLVRWFRRRCYSCSTRQVPAAPEPGSSEDDDGDGDSQSEGQVKNGSRLKSRSPGAHPCSTD